MQDVRNLLRKSSVSYSDNTMSAKGFVWPDGVEIETNFAGRTSKEFIDMKSRIQEKAIRDWLINQGWKPPKEVE